MKFLITLLISAILTLSWQLDRVTAERDEAHAMVQDALSLIPKWEQQAKRSMDSAEYWYQAHMNTVIHYENRLTP
jgi:hypothetical protein